MYAEFNELRQRSRKGKEIASEGVGRQKRTSLKDNSTTARSNNQDLDGWVVTRGKRQLLLTQEAVSSPGEERPSP